MIKEIDDYFGYIAWSKVFVFETDKRVHSQDVLVELVMKSP